MSRFDGSLARTLDFGEIAATATMSGTRRASLRLAQAGDRLRGPDKYGVLAHRRHQAQIKARRLLDLMEGN